MKGRRNGSLWERMIVFSRQWQGGYKRCDGNKGWIVLNWKLREKKGDLEGLSSFEFGLNG